MVRNEISSFTGLLLGIGITLSGVAIHEQHSTAKYKPQVQNIIGDPNATDPNDTYIQTPNGRAYLAIDGLPTEIYVELTRKKLELKREDLELQKGLEKID